MNGAGRLRLALVLQLIGLLVEIVSILFFQPLTFMAFVGWGAPFIVAGVLLYLDHVRRLLMEKGVL